MHRPCFSASFFLTAFCSFFHFLPTVQRWFFGLFLFLMFGKAKPVLKSKVLKMVILNCVKTAYSIRIHQIKQNKFLVNKTLANGQILSWRFSSLFVAFRFAHFLGVPKKQINKLIQLSLF